MHERRKHQRFKIDNTCIINHEQAVGIIIDISIGGFSCMCLDQGEPCEGLSTQVNIFCRKYDICAEDINVRILGTEMVPGEFMAELGIRKCRAQFRQLDEPQLSQLANLIVKSAHP